MERRSLSVCGLKEIKTGFGIGEKSARKTVKGAALRVCLAYLLKIEKAQQPWGLSGTIYKKLCKIGVYLY